MKGNKFDTGKPRFSLLPLKPLQEVIKVLEFGAQKYAPNNWKKLDNPEVRYLDAAMRHLLAHQSGQVKDRETRLPHLAHAICCLLFTLHFTLLPKRTRVRDVDVTNLETTAKEFQARATAQNTKEVKGK